MNVYFLDSDAARCLCQYQLLYELTGALGCTLAELAVLPQLKFQLKLGTPKAQEKLGSPEAVELAQHLVEEASEVTVDAESANAVSLSNRPDIDAGELVLFAAICGDNQSALITGDKRALAALSVLAIPQVDAVWTRLICLEEAMALIVAHIGLEPVSIKVRARCDVNIALTLSFGRTSAASITSVREGLSSYVAEVIRMTQGKYQLKDFPKVGVCINRG